MNMIMKLQDWVLQFGCLLALVAGGPCSGQAQAQVPAARPARAIDATVLKGVALDRDRQPEAADGVTRIADVIYGRKFGMALTMDVLRPRQPNQAAVVWAVSGGFKSDHGDMAGPEFVKYMSAFLDRGYTVFAVVHGSSPKFEMREVSADMHRAVRFIRHHAGDFGIDARRIGISGASAGGVIALWLGTQGRAGDPAAIDPVDRESSQVQAVACFYPGVDWVHWEEDGSNCLARTRRLGLIDGFRFRDFDPVKKEFVEETDPEKIDGILAEYSPINHVSPKSAPTFILHGDKDQIVRIEQATMMVDKLKEAGVAARLVVKEGAGHSWPGQDQDLKLFADWYDEHLRNSVGKARP